MDGRLDERATGIVANGAPGSHPGRLTSNDQFEDFSFTRTVLAFLASSGFA